MVDPQALKLVSSSSFLSTKSRSFCLERLIPQQNERVSSSQLSSNQLTPNQGTPDKQQLIQAVEQLLASEWQHWSISPEWRHWLIENQLLNVPEYLLVQTIVQSGIDAQLATRVVQATAKAVQAVTEALQVEPRLSQGWQQWLLENRSRNVPDQVLIQTMVQNGISAQLAAQAVQSSYAQLLLQSKQLNDSADIAAQLLAKLESILGVNRKLEELSPNFGTIERVERLSKQEFLEKYYATGTPVIITGMMDDWAAMPLWSPEYIKSNYGSSQVEIQMGREADADYEINGNHHKKTISLGEYVDMVTHGGETNDYYLVANNQNLEREDLKSLLKDMVFPDFLDQTNIQQRVFFWFGPAGTITPLHHDPVNVMMAHVCGRKRWRLISPNNTPLLYNFVGVYSKIDLEAPDYEQYPLFKQVKVIETVLEPGELIFVPVGWWHQVKAFDISLSVSFSNFAFPNEYPYHHPNIRWNDSQAPADSGKGAIAKKNSKVAQPQINPTTVANGKTNHQLSLQSQPLTYESVKRNTTDGYLVDEIFKHELLIIAFGFVSWDGPPGFDFYGRTKKLEGLAQKPINRILLRDFENAWYHRGVLGLGSNVDEVSDRLQQMIEQISPSRVVTIGQSMGAYAAIMFGQLIDADQVLAFGPLSFLDAQKAREVNDKRWLPVMQELAANPPEVSYFDLLTLGSREHPPAIEVFYGKKPDPETPGEINLDDIHAHRLAQLSNCTLHPYENSGHAIVQHLIDHKLIDQVLLKSLFGLELDTSLQENSIPDEWQAWIRENLARGVLPAHLMPSLRQHGFSDTAIAAALSQGQRI